ncbi:MAG: hypothetical protein COW00_11610 [Bdellovibrio sp. CG12_big_fil_rev_8_21_14_0_65_39_13]|nr:MAG: hypothetical protein COW78_04710 [Bdellovibrio sp. CG22_combo_CG10-13_8_21_14_all_39_27]PIQ59368.1 MAG: hypothetical protein COW00_11610 [Bdellovibrio sp. CG12_big_fil_rev_8_21_14_0_65_39_13]PIR32789.1 MAG: hypothetical protein COV37_18865 [Bdellovibrio sp. CG11_big_fil_rev_8_21_14_0_20_39_38]
MKLILLSLVLVVLSSCQTNRSMTDVVAPKLEEIVEKDGQNFSGTVVYNPHGIDQLTRARRNSALTRAREVCSPKSYRIIKETIQKPEERDPLYKGNPSLLTGSSLNFIDYQCE